MKSFFVRFTLASLLCSMVSCAAGPYHGSSYGRSYSSTGSYGSSYNYQSYAARQEAERKRRNNAAATAVLGLLVLGALAGSGSGGGSSSDDDGFKCPKCGRDADAFVGYCSQCAGVIQEQMQRNW